MAQAAQRALPHTILLLDTQTPRYKWLVAGIVLLACATQIFAGTSLNIAIPRLMVTFGTDLPTTQWVATGFLVTRTLVIPLLGWLGSMLGNRNLFVAIMVGFVVTSVGCGLSTSLPMLIAFRALQGAVLGPMEGLTAVILVQAFPPQQRGLAIGLRSIGWALGELLFYTVGGYLFEHISWRLLFFLGIPSGIAVAVLGFLMLPQDAEVRSPSVDYLGLVFLGTFLVPLLLVISFGRDSETGASTLITLGLTALVGGGLFVAREWFTAFPAVNLRLFQQRTFCLLCGSAFFNSMGLFGGLFMVPIFLQQVMGFTPLQAGLLLLPALPFSVLSGLVTGRLSDRFPPPLVAITGLLALTAIFHALSSVTMFTTVAVLVGYMILYRAFMDTVGIPITALTMQTLGPEQARMGQGLLGVMRSIGSSFGVTVTSVFFERRRAWHQFQAYTAYDNDSPAHEAALSELRLVLHHAGVGETLVDQEALGTIREQMDIEAIALGFQESFLFICLCFLLAIGPMLCLLSRKITTQTPLPEGRKRIKV
jgi:MFS transporter, DHA2 family, multidrug resistance protein